MFQQALETISKQVLIRPTYDNFIGGKLVAPVEGRYFDNLSPITGAKLCQIARSTAADIDLALDAAHKAKDAWGRTPVAERSVILNKIADKMAANLDLLALVETLDNGKPIREIDLCRLAAVRRPLALLRRRHPRPGRRHFRNRPRHRRLSLTMSRSASSARSFPGTSRC